MCGWISPCERYLWFCTCHRNLIFGFCAALASKHRPIKPINANRSSVMVLVSPGRLWTTIVRMCLVAVTCIFTRLYAYWLWRIVFGVLCYLVSFQALRRERPTPVLTAHGRFCGGHCLRCCLFRSHGALAVPAARLVTWRINELPATMLDTSRPLGK